MVEIQTFHKPTLPIKIIQKEFEMLAVNPLPEKESKLFIDIENWRSTYNKLLEDNNQIGDSAKHYQDIVGLINLFEQFCKDYINRFYDKSVNLDEAAFPPEWLANTIEKVLLGYWEPIERAAEQYQVRFYRDWLDCGYRKLETSQKGSQPIGKDKSIVLYLEKTGVYKRYPFGNIYLIGIPLMDAYNDEWNAMWHELGHHLYWNSQINFESQNYYQGKGPGLFAQALNEAVLSLKARDAEKRRIREILNLWTEELFADVIGTKIAGKDFVNAAWEKISRESETTNDLFKSDGKHPIPFFLPHIRSFVIGEKFSIPQDTWDQRF
jgi:hypothetical protein